MTGHTNYPPAEEFLHSLGWCAREAGFTNSGGNSLQRNTYVGRIGIRQSGDFSMTENDVMAELSYAYLHAVASRAGFGCKEGNRIEDNAGVDALLRVDERLSPNSKLWNFYIEIQLKATQKVIRAREGRYPYFFQGVSRYDGLREPGSPLSKLLVVLFLPTNREQWLRLDERSLISRRCAYWVSLNGAPPSTNDTGQTVYLPQRQLLSVENLRDVATRLSRQEELTYEE